MTTGAPVPKLLHPLINRFEGEVDGGTCAPFQQLISLPREVESCHWRSSFKVLRPPDLTSLSNSTTFQLPRLLSPQQIHCLNSIAGYRIPDTTKKPPEIPLLRSQSALGPIAPRLELLKYDFITGPDNRPATVKEPTILRLPPSAFASFVPPQQSFYSKSPLNRKQTAYTVMQEVSVQLEESLGPTQQNALAKERDHLKAPPACVAGNRPLVDKSSQCSPSKFERENTKEEEQKTPLFEIKDNPQETPVLQPQPPEQAADKAVSPNRIDEVPLDVMLQNLLQETQLTPTSLNPRHLASLAPQALPPLTDPRSVSPSSSPLFQSHTMCPNGSTPPVAEATSVGIATSPEVRLGGGSAASNQPSQQSRQLEDYQELDSRLAAIDRAAEKIEQEYERNKELLQTFLYLHSTSPSKTVPSESKPSSGKTNTQKSAKTGSITPEAAAEYHFDGPAAATSPSPLPREEALGGEDEEEEGAVVPAGCLRILRSVLEARTQSRLSSAPTSARLSSRVSTTAPSTGRQTARRTTYTRDLTHQGPLRRELQYRLAERRRKEAKDYATKILAELEQRSSNRTPASNPRPASILGSCRPKTTSKTVHSSRQECFNRAPSSSRSLSGPRKRGTDARTLKRTIAKQSKLTAASPRAPESAQSPQKIRYEQDLDDQRSLKSDWSGNELIKKILRGSPPSGKTSPSKVERESLLKDFLDSATPNSSVFIDWDKIDELIESS